MQKSALKGNKTKTVLAWEREARLFVKTEENIRRVSTKALQW